MRKSDSVRVYLSAAHAQREDPILESPQPDAVAINASSKMRAANIVFDLITTVREGMALIKAGVAHGMHRTKQHLLRATKVKLNRLFAR